MTERKRLPSRLYCLLLPKPENSGSSWMASQLGCHLDVGSISHIFNWFLFFCPQYHHSEIHHLVLVPVLPWQKSLSAHLTPYHLFHFLQSISQYLVASLFGVYFLSLNSKHQSRCLGHSCLSQLKWMVYSLYSITT